MAGIQEYKCPCCGGAIEFNSSVQKMKCPYCDTEFEMEALAAYDAELSGDAQENMEWNTDSMQEWQEGDTEGLRVYVCQSCGGEITADENTAASACPFCDNPIVMKGNVAGGLKPKLIIPFKLDKKAAKAKYLEHLSGKKLLPSVFKDPYWLFDSKADVHMRYKATKTRHWSDSSYNYTETSYYAVMRGGKIAFEHVPVDGSSKLADDMMESLEPYDYKEAVDFQTAYFAGYLADKYDVGEEESIKRANDRVKQASSDAFRSTVKGFTTVTPDGGSIITKDGKAEYVMYPLWLLNTKWNGEKYTFAMNGQTGKFVGNLPVDKAKANQILFSTAGIVAGISLLVQLLFYAIF